MSYSQIVAMFILAALLSGCLLPEGIQETERSSHRLIDEGVVESRYLTIEGVRFHYVLREAQSDYLIFFIHGTPGEWTIFGKQLEDELLFGGASIVALDRPGWGQSDIISGERAVSLEAQSRLIAPALAQIKAQLKASKVMLVGHSLGASLVPRIAIDYPGLADYVVAVAGDLTDEYPAARWYNYVADSGWLSWMVPETMALANDEVLALEASLAKMGDDWAKLHEPLLVLQGEEDGLVDPRHADFAQQLKTGSTVRVVRLNEAGHLMHLSHSDNINGLIYQALTTEVPAEEVSVEQ